MAKLIFRLVLLVTMVAALHVSALKPVKASGGCGLVDGVCFDLNGACGAKGGDCEGVGDSCSCHIIP